MSCRMSLINGTHTHVQHGATKATAYLEEDADARIRAQHRAL